MSGFILLQLFVQGEMIMTVLQCAIFIEWVLGVSYYKDTRSSIRGGRKGSIVFIKSLHVKCKNQAIYLSLFACFALG